MVRIVLHRKKNTKTYEVKDFSWNSCKNFKQQKLNFYLILCKIYNGHGHPKNLYQWKAQKKINKSKKTPEKVYMTPDPLNLHESQWQKRTYPLCHFITKFLSFI